MEGESTADSIRIDTNLTRVQPYLDVLPSKFSIPLFWSIEYVEIVHFSPSL